MKKILSILFVLISVNSFAQVYGYSGITLRARDSSVLYQLQNYSGGSPNQGLPDWYHLRPVYKEEITYGPGLYALRYNPTTKKVYYTDTTSGGGSGNTNSNVGLGYRLAIPWTNDIKTLGANYGIILDSATSNQIGIKADTATLFPAVRATISGGGSPGGSTKQIQYNNSGSFGGATGFEYGNTNNSVLIISQAAADIALKIQAHASQTALITQWQNSAGTKQAGMTKDGELMLYTAGGYDVGIKNALNGADPYVYMTWYTNYNIGFFANATATYLITNSPKFQINQPVNIANAASSPLVVTAYSGLNALEVGRYSNVEVNKGNQSAGFFQVHGSVDNNLIYGDFTNDKVGIGTGSPNSKLQVSGSFASAYVSKSADYTATISDCVIEVTATGKTITLPTAVGITGRMYTIKLTASGSGTVATTSSQNIDASTTYSLSAQYKYVTVQSNGSNWIIIANN